MEIDNSAADAFRECPTKFFNSYLAEGTGIEARSVSEYGPLDLGKRVHELLEEHYGHLPSEYEGVGRLYLPSPNPELEAEAQVIMAAYKQHYPSEDFTVVDVERSIRVELPAFCQDCGERTKTRQEANPFSCEDIIVHDCVSCGDPFKRYPQSKHIYTGKIDLCVRQPDGTLAIIDHKTEKRTSRNNAPEAWAARDQATLYLWAAERIYGEPIEAFYVNVLRRPDKKNGPEFPERQKLERTPAQIEKAIRDITLIADHIEDYRSRFLSSEWPSYTKNCIGRYGKCEFFTPCVYGWSDDIRRLQYQPKTPYLTLAGVPILQNNS